MEMYARENSIAKAKAAAIAKAKARIFLLSLLLSLWDSLFLGDNVCLWWNGWVGGVPISQA